jgi:hypothetical protein
MGDVTSTITEAAVAALTPAVERIVTERIMPMMIVGLIAGAVAASFVGTWFGVRAARAHGGIRRNPVARVHVLPRRRSA